MWCRHCLREVQASSSGMSPASCPLCGRTVESVTRQSQAIRQAREILERWQSSDLFDRIQNPEAPAAPQKQQAPLTPPRIPLQRADRQIGLSTPPSADESPSNSSVSVTSTATELSPSDTLAREVPTQNDTEKRQRRIVNSGPPLTSVVREVPQLPPDFSAPPLMVAAVQKLHAAQVKSNPSASVIAVPQSSANSSTKPAVTRVAVDVPIPLASDPTAPPGFPQSPDRDTTRRDGDQALSTDVDSSQATRDFIAAFFETSGAELMEPSAVASSASADTSRPAGSNVAATQEPLSGSVSPEISSDVAAAVSVPLAAHKVASPPSHTPSDRNAMDMTPVKTRVRTPLTRPALHRKSLQASGAAGQTLPATARSTDVTAASAVTGNAEAPSPVTTPAAPAPQRSVHSLSDQPDTAATSQRLRPAPVNPTERRTMNSRASQQRFVDAPHAVSGRGPHFEAVPPRRTNLTSIIGQTLSYIGVLGLTIGTSMVIYGHFGGFAEYTPTGWLVTTVAQMLLFLGVINLVSGGMEQNNEDMSRRIQSLGEQLQRIEQATYMTQPEDSADSQTATDDYADSPDYARTVAGSVR